MLRGLCPGVQWLVWLLGLAWLSLLLLSGLLPGVSSFLHPHWAVASRDAHLRANHRLNTLATLEQMTGGIEEIVADLPLRAVGQVSHHDLSAPDVDPPDWVCQD